MINLNLYSKNVSFIGDESLSFVIASFVTVAAVVVVIMMMMTTTTTLF